MSLEAHMSSHINTNIKNGGDTLGKECDLVIMNGIPPEPKGIQCAPISFNCTDEDFKVKRVINQKVLPKHLGINARKCNFEGCLYTNNSNTGFYTHRVM